MTDDDDVLAGIDLHKWRVPPAREPAPAILLRALGTTPPARPRRMIWLIGGLAVVNAALLAFVISRPPRIVETVRAAGPADPRVHELLRQLDDEQRELARRIAELEELRALTAQLAERLRRLEERDKHAVPEPPPPPPPADPGDCDEVSCLLEEHAGACCAKYRRPPASPGAGPPVALDRAMISAGMTAVRPSVDACRSRSPAKGIVKVKVQVDGAGGVRSVEIVAAPDPVLGACVAAAVHKAPFAATQQGGSFSYPFVF